MDILKTENRCYRINVIVFTIIGMIFYISNLFSNNGVLDANPLYFEGGAGIFISIIGGVTAYYYFIYMRFPIFRIAIISIILVIVWFSGVIYIGTNLNGPSNAIISFLWIGFLTIMYFMAIGGINGLFGYWISLFNILIVVNTIYTQDISPIIWINILEVVGIENIYFQWGIVILSAILGIADKGIDIFKES